MRKFRILALMLVLIMVLAGCGTGNSTPAAKDIVILYTNDAHCGIEDGMGYQAFPPPSVRCWPQAIKSCW